MTTETATDIENTTTFDLFLERRVADWRATPGQPSPWLAALPEYLGMTPDEYGEWALGRTTTRGYRRLMRVWQGWQTHPVSNR